jgi:RND family efflux transporter MFP subunit
VRTASAESRQVERFVDLAGSLLPDESVNLSAEVAGTLARVYVDFGQSVRAGQVVAELDSRELSLQVESRRAALNQALARIGLAPNQESVNPDSTPAIRQAAAQVDDARFKYESAASLVKTGDVSRERYVELEKAFHAREAALQAARDELRTQLAVIDGLRADLRLAQKRLGDTVVRAPFDGAVTAKLISPGQYIKENTAILTVVKSSPLRLRTEIPESAVGSVRAGTSVTFTTEAVPGKVFHAVVRELNPSLDSRSRSLTAEARLVESDPRLKPGMFVQTRVSSGKVEVIVVPRGAVYSVAGLTKVYVIRGGTAVECKVQPGQQFGDLVEVQPAAGGLKTGDLIAVSNVGNLVNGSKVAVKG